ncbi:hypothetical protein AB0H34_37610 [Saccharopolyspora shandongensis]|uniref:hypothetical protein n=1 Tax=Saccharopolyspora shandongensis TaxID=418495 RepID=UPI0034033A67
MNPGTAEAVRKAVVVIPHWLSTIVAADQVVVFDGGQIVQQGTHTDLLADPTGRYARMWNAQLRSKTRHGAAAG